MQLFKSLAKKCCQNSKSLFSVVFVSARNLCKKIISFFLIFFRRSPRALAAIITIILVLSCAVTVVLATGTTTAYSVVYNGEIIATIKEPSVLAEAEIFAANKLNNPACTPHLIKTELTQTIAIEKNLVCSTELADSIIERSENIVTANVLKIDGDVVAIGNSNSEINDSIASFLSTYRNDNNVDNIEISNDFDIAEIYTSEDAAASLPLVDNYLESGENALSLQTVSSVVLKEEIPFETIETESDLLALGTKEITQTGVKGEKEVTYKVYSSDGVETGRTIESEKIISEPTVQKVSVGTKKVVASYDNGRDTSMRWPVKRVERSYVSSYMGDGRGHKGMDIVAPAGTPIYAATGGTVSFSGWDSSGYGYKIIIKHSDGYETLYAHCSALFVKQGDVVVEGENIASVGTTGRSTGNHLHFEVRQNGSIKNPSNYIGRN